MKFPDGMKFPMDGIGDIQPLPRSLFRFFLRTMPLAFSLVDLQLETIEEGRAKAEAEVRAKVPEGAELVDSTTYVPLSVVRQLLLAGNHMSLSLGYQLGKLDAPLAELDIEKLMGESEEFWRGQHD